MSVNRSDSSMTGSCRDGSRTSGPRSTDDTRESLAQAIHTSGAWRYEVAGKALAWMAEQGYSKQHPPTAAEIGRVADVIADALLADNPEVQSVNMRDARVAARAALGAVRPAPEPEWEYECRVARDEPGWTWRSCVEDGSFCPTGSERRRRHPAVPAGPWEPVPEPTEGETR